MSALPSAAAAATGCPTLTDLPSTALGTLDTTNPSGAWEQGSPAGTVDVPLTGDALVVDQMEYSINCGTPVPVLGFNSTAPVIGEGSKRLTHRVHDSVTSPEPSFAALTCTGESGSSERTPPVSECPEKLAPDKSDPAENAKGFKTKPWTVRVEGLPASREHVHGCTGHSRTQRVW